MTDNRTEKLKSGEIVQIAGAGPGGLSAAIILARAGIRVEVHEAHHEVGYRFQGDLQGLENWSTEHDVLAIFQQQGLPTDFVKIPCRQGMAFDAWSQCYEMRSPEPIFYLLERGPGPDTLDTALLTQAQALGVEIHFNSRLNAITGQGILATGPKNTNAIAIAVGYHFETEMEDGFWIICDNNLAPQGYAYLLIMRGLGTVKSCMFTGFTQEKLYVERTVAAFERLLGLRMVNRRPHGGATNFRFPSLIMEGIHPIAGEQAGVQDNLWGFGIRLAVTSGILAAQSLLQGTDYKTQCQRELGSLAQTSAVNRAIYASLGNRGYRWFLRYTQKQSDVRVFLHNQYHPSLCKRLLSPWANQYQKKRQ